MFTLIVYLFLLHPPAGDPKPLIEYYHNIPTMNECLKKGEERATELKATHPQDTVLQMCINTTEQ
jgi:hypothetical protein